MGLANAVGEAVLSLTMPTVLMGLPANLDNSSNAGTAALDICPAVMEVWKMYLNPRAVMLSANDRVNMGSSARSVTSVMAKVKEDSQEPVAPVRSGSWDNMR